MPSSTWSRLHHLPLQLPSSLLCCHRACRVRLEEVHIRITLSMQATNCGLFFRVIPRRRNFMVSVESSKMTEACTIEIWNEKKLLSKLKTKPGFQNKINTAQTTETKALKRSKESKQHKTTVKQNLQRNVNRQFYFRGFYSLSPVILYWCSLVSIFSFC